MMMAMEKSARRDKADKETIFKWINTIERNQQQCGLK